MLNIHKENRRPRWNEPFSIIAIMLTSGCAGSRQIDILLQMQIVIEIFTYITNVAYIHQIDTCDNSMVYMIIHNSWKFDK